MIKTTLVTCVARSKKEETIPLRMSGTDWITLIRQSFPYQHSSHVGYKERTRDTASSSEWRIKDPNKKRQEHKAVDSWNKSEQGDGKRRSSPDS